MRLGELLVGAGILTSSQLEEALGIQAQHKGVRLGQILVDHRMVPESTVVDALARISGIERLDLVRAEIDPSAAHAVTSAWASDHVMAPFAVDRQRRTLYVAVADPTDVVPLDDLSFRTGYRVVARLGSEREVQNLVRHLFFGGELVRAVATRRPERRNGSQLEVLHGIEAARELVQHDGPVTRTGRAIQASEIKAASDIIPLTGEARVQRPQNDDVDLDPVTGQRVERPRERRRPGPSTSPAPPTAQRPSEPPRAGAGPPRAGAEPARATATSARASGGPGSGEAPRAAATSAPQSGPAAPAWSTAAAPADRPAGEVAELAALAQHLRALIQQQQQSALELQALFEACVAHGLLDRAQYLARVADLERPR
jgi:hypothetical protein